jgi:hypothetical protein
MRMAQPSRLHWWPGIGYNIMVPSKLSISIFLFLWSLIHFIARYCLLFLRLRRALLAAIPHSRQEDRETSLYIQGGQLDSRSLDRLVVMYIS